MKRLTVGAAAVGILIALAAVVAATQLPAIGAGALLFPTRRAAMPPRPAACVERSFDGLDLALAGWECRTSLPAKRGTIVYLHGIADNRGSAGGIIETFVPLGFDVIAYDSRAHGASEGDRCTYGYFEKRDLQRVLDELQIESAIAMGHSLGAAVALQAAAIDPRIHGVIAIATFADLRSIATERAFYFPSWSLAPAFARAERDGHFLVDDVSPVKAAAQISVPALLVHGAEDRDTPPIHSERVLNELRGRKELIVVPGATHVNVLNAKVMARVAAWLNETAHAGNEDLAPSLPFSSLPK